VVQKILKEARVARLAALDRKGRPHIVPVCFAYDGKRFYTAVDEKPKRVPRERLARLENIPGAAPRFAFNRRLHRRLDTTQVCPNTCQSEVDSEVSA
jgi:hypothetical protein